LEKFVHSISFKQNSPDLASLILCSLLVFTHCVVLR